MIGDMYINYVNLVEEKKNQNVKPTPDKHDIMFELLIKWWRVKLGNNFTRVLSKF